MLPITGNIKIALVRRRLLYALLGPYTSIYNEYICVHSFCHQEHSLFYSATKGYKFPFWKRIFIGFSLNLRVSLRSVAAASDLSKKIIFFSRASKACEPHRTYNNTWSYALTIGFTKKKWIFSHVLHARACSCARHDKSPTTNGHSKSSIKKKWRARAAGDQTRFVLCCRSLRSRPAALFVAPWRREQPRAAK